MASVNSVFQVAARLSAIGKGHSLNDRDLYSRLAFDGHSCEIISAGLFAVVSLTLPLEWPFGKRLEFEAKNEMLHSISQVMNLDDLGVEGIYDEVRGAIEPHMIRLTSKGVQLDLPTQARWSGFRFLDCDQVEFVSVSSHILAAVLSSVPKLRQDDSEKRLLSAMRIEADKGIMLCQSTNNNRIVASISVPCSGVRLMPILVPFAIVPLLRWAIEEFAEDQCKIGMFGDSVVFECGVFRCVIKQIVSQFPAVSELIQKLTNRKANQNGVVTSNLLSASKQAVQLGHQACTLSLERNSRFMAGSANERFSIKLETMDPVEEGCGVTVSMDSSYLTAAMTCFSKLGFETPLIQYKDAKEPVLFSATSDEIEADIMIATMDRVGV